MNIRPRMSTRALALMVFSLTGLAALTAVSALAPPPPGTTYTGVLEFRTFIQDCKCYPWVIDKKGRVAEADVSAVQRDADALVGKRVKATGRWFNYRRDGQTIRYLKVTQLDPS